MAPQRWKIVLALSAVASEAHGHDFRDHPRWVLSLEQYPQFSVVGELERDEKLNGGRITQHFGSAVIVSPCYILTNFHVAFGDTSLPVLGKDYTAIFRAGHGSNGGAFAGHTSAKPVLWGDQMDDWALMRLQNCVGLLPDFGWIESSYRSRGELQHDKAEIAVLGYAFDTQRGEMSISTGSVRDGYRPGQPGTLFVDASGTHKQSGAP